MRWRLLSTIALGGLTLLTCSDAIAQERDRSVILTEGGGPVLVSRAAKPGSPQRAARVAPGDPTPTPAPRPKRYWADPLTHTIRRANVDGSQAQVVLHGVNTPYGLSYDPLLHQLVWTSSGDETVQAVAVGSAEPITLPSSFEGDYAVEVSTAGSERRIAYALLGGDIVRLTQDAASGTESSEIVLTLPAPEKVHGLAVSADGGRLYLGDTAGRMSQTVRLTDAQLEVLSFIDEVPAPASKPQPEPPAARAPAKGALR